MYCCTRPGETPRAAAVSLTVSSSVRMYSWTASARIVAASIIDWTNLGQRIGDRERPLADKTMKRIQAGINRYWAVPEREPLIVNQVSGADASRSTPVRDAAPTMVAGGRHASLLVPVEGRAGKAAGSIAEPYRTQTTRNETGLLATAPFIAELRGGGSDALDDTATGNGDRFGQSPRTRDAEQPRRRRDEHTGRRAGSHDHYGRASVAHLGGYSGDPGLLLPDAVAEGDSASHGVP